LKSLVFGGFIVLAADPRDIDAVVEIRMIPAEEVSIICKLPEDFLDFV
jgi:hypothetical protein